MKVIIAGSRTITRMDDLLVAIRLAGFDITEVVCGGARGVDHLGKVWAKNCAIPVKMFYPNWAAWGKGAGHIRNQFMANYADALIAIMVKEGSKGTQDMIKRAQAKGLRVYVHLV